MGKWGRSLHARNQAIGLLIISLLVLSGCAVEENSVTESPVPNIKQQDSSITEITDAEYEEALERIRAEEELAAELLERVEATETATGQDTSQTSKPSESHTSQNDESHTSQSDEILEISPGSSESTQEVKALTIAQLAYAQVSAFADGSSVAPADSVIASPNLPSFHIKGLIDITSKAMSMFDEQYALPNNYKVIAFTDKDFDWADQKLVEYNGQLPDGSWSKAFASTNQSPDRCWMAIASNGNTHFCMSIDAKIAQQQINTTAHEYFHIVQMGPIGLKPLITPVWITEGGAEYFGWVISERGSGYTLNKLAGWQTRYLSTTFGGSGYRDYLKAMTRNEFVLAMQSLEGGSLNPDTRDSHYKFDMYKLGAAANEYLIGKYSYNTYMNFLESIGNGGVPWSSAFIDSFGIKPSEFYSTLYDYLKNAIIK